MSDLDERVGPDGKCVLTGHPCTCIPKTLGHWCCWSIPKEQNEPATPEPCIPTEEK